jgi:hypothetical protein
MSAAEAQQRGNVRIDLRSSDNTVATTCTSL